MASIIFKNNVTRTLLSNHLLTNPSIGINTTAKCLSIISSNYSLPLPFTSSSFQSKSIIHHRQLSSSSTSSTSSSSFDIPDSSFHLYSEDIKTMTNEQLSNPTTIPGFTTLIHSPPRDRNSIPRNALIGKVVSDKMMKTVNVAVDRYKIIPKYRKRVKYTKKFMAHDEEEVCKEGDLVMIAPCHRISRHKHFRVHEILRTKG